MTHEEICTYEVAKLAKEKGFTWKCRDYYNMDSELRVNGIYSLEYTNLQIDEGYMTAPAQSLLQRWLREEKGIVVEVKCLPTTRTSSKYEYKRHLFWGSDGHYLEGEYGDDIFDTYELALEDALKYALENLV